ncbi:hypothetical protein Tco_1542122 [Tanacetum coccineum]
MPPKDDVLLAEQPLPASDSPNADSPGYITESDPEEDPKEEDDEDPEEDPADYSNDKDDDDEEESLKDDVDDEEEEEDEEEKDEHLAPADSVPPPQTGTCRARMIVRPQPPMAAYTEALIAAVATTLPLPSPPPSPLTSYSSPLPQIPSPPLPVSSPLPMSPPPLPISPTHPLGYRAESPSNFHPLPLPLPPPIILPRTKESMVLMRVAAPYTYILAPRSRILPSGTPPLRTPPLLPIPSPTSSPPLLLPSTDCRSDVPEVMLPHWKRLCIAPGPRYKIRESPSAPTARPTGGFRADYVFVGTMDAKIRCDLDREISYGITDV